MVGTTTDVTTRKEAQNRLGEALADNQRLVGELKEALANLKVLGGLLPICCYCKKIRSDEGYWHQLERFITERTDAKLSHSICPACMKEHFGIDEEG
jgi:hypothetical protein